MTIHWIIIIKLNKKKTIKLCILKLIVSAMMNNQIKQI